MFFLSSFNSHISPFQVVGNAMEDIEDYKDILREVQRRLKQNYIHSQTYKQEFDVS